MGKMGKQKYYQGTNAGGPSDTLCATMQTRSSDPSGEKDLFDPLVVGVHKAQPRKFPRPTDPNGHPSPTMDRTCSTLQAEVDTLW